MLNDEFRVFSTFTQIACLNQFIIGQNDDYYYNFVLVFAVCILCENNKIKMHILMGAQVEQFTSKQSQSTIKGISFDPHLATYDIRQFTKRNRVRSKTLTPKTQSGKKKKLQTQSTL